jgi:hypothetical protein
MGPPVPWHKLGRITGMGWERNRSRLGAAITHFVTKASGTQNQIGKTLLQWPSTIRQWCLRLNQIRGKHDEKAESLVNTRKWEREQHQAYHDLTGASSGYDRHGQLPRSAAARGGRRGRAHCSDLERQLMLNISNNNCRYTYIPFVVEGFQNYIGIYKIIHGNDWLRESLIMCSSNMFFHRQQ